MSKLVSNIIIAFQVARGPLANKRRHCILLIYAKDKFVAKLPFIEENFIQLGGGGLNHKSNYPALQISSELFMKEGCVLDIHHQPCCSDSQELNLISFSFCSFFNIFIICKLSDEWCLTF